jgi:FAD/FMN-containing dehydrogenase
MVSRSNDRILARLEAVVGARSVVTDPDVLHSHMVDWTGRFSGHAPALVRPGTVEEVSAVVAICNEERVALVPQGGNTGLVGGSVPLGGEIVLSLRRLDDLRPVDELARQVTAGAGVTLAALHQAARDSGLAYGVDLAARDSATVGGMVATNAGGVHVLRWGDTRRQLRGIEAVMADGSVVSHLGGLLKDNTGYDLAGLLCGSEGTLGVITAARLQLLPLLPERVVALVGLSSLSDACRATSRWTRDVESIAAVEVFFHDGLALVCETEHLAAPFAESHPVYVLVEAAGRVDPLPALAAAIEGTAAVLSVAVATDEPGCHRLWAYRELHTTAINTLGPPHKFDVTLPAAQIARFADEVRRRVSELAPTARSWLFGHLADGNLHVNVTGLATDDEQVDEVVFGLVVSLGGSISAEHGIGTAKKQWIGLNRSAPELATFGAIKSALDPNHILNPNVLLPD